MVARGATPYGHSGIISALFLAASGTVSPTTRMAAMTIPSADVTLPFVQSGPITEIHFKEGGKVSTTLR